MKFDIWIETKRYLSDLILIHRENKMGGTYTTQVDEKCYKVVIVKLEGIIQP
jgi:hypothetical protein